MKDECMTNYKWVRDTNRRYFGFKIEAFSLESKSQIIHN